jgi:hypothetical protein
MLSSLELNVFTQSVGIFTKLYHLLLQISKATS